MSRLQRLSASPKKSVRISKKPQYLSKDNDVFYTPKELKSGKTSRLSYASPKRSVRKSTRLASKKSKNQKHKEGSVKPEFYHQCQAMTKMHHQCTRPARVAIDLTVKRFCWGVSLPTMNCCFYCTAHTAVLAGIGISKLLELYAFKDYSYDQYLTVNPDYLEEQIEKLK